MSLHYDIIYTGDIMLKNTNLNVRVNSEKKEKVENILKSLGVTLSGVIEMLMTQIITKRGIPFEVTLPSEEKAKEALEIGKIINSLGGTELKPKLEKIVYLYIKGDISYNVAMFAIKEELLNNEWSIPI